MRPAPLPMRRRNFLRGAATASAASPVALPTYIAFQGPPTDLPGSPDGLVPPSYLNYPLNPVKSVPQPVGNGEQVTEALRRGFVQHPELDPSLTGPLV